MKLKYPKMKTGLLLLAVGILLECVGNVLVWAYNFAVLMWENPVPLNTIGNVYMLIGEILMVIGLLVAAKERRRYITVLLVLLGKHAVSFWHGFFLGLEVSFFSTPLGIISKIISFISIWFVCAETAKLLKEEGIEKLTKLCLPTYIGYGIFYGYSVLVMVASNLMNAMQRVFAISSLCVYIAVFIGGIAYILFSFLAASRIKKISLESK